MPGTSLRNCEDIQGPGGFDDSRFVRQAVERADCLELALADVEGQVLRKITSRQFRRPAARDGVAGDDPVNIGQAALFRLLQARMKRGQVGGAIGHPGGEDEGEAGELLPFLAEVELVGEASGLVGREVDVRITSNVQTSVGRMLFASVVAG